MVRLIIAPGTSPKWRGSLVASISSSVGLGQSPPSPAGRDPLPFSNRCPEFCSDCACGPGSAIEFDSDRDSDRALDSNSPPGFDADRDCASEELFVALSPSPEECRCRSFWSPSPHPLLPRPTLAPRRVG